MVYVDVFDGAKIDVRTHKVFGSNGEWFWVDEITVRDKDGQGLFVFKNLGRAGAAPAELTRRFDGEVVKAAVAEAA